ncbi:hypothetical protein F0U60_40350 [Archangium minus]|uniref:Uncharacterized protein n=1 Tax=Archangium minus TaxID=83450 RepID=A0ABY9X2R4_9BACT|nr:hypothetical protein F0U60_40350 [Archangium minus]
MKPDLIKNTLSLLQEVALHASTSEQRDALENCMLTLHFISGRGEAGEFSDYAESFDTAPLTPVLSFATKDEADGWLRNHPAPPHGATIRAADVLYTVAYSRELEHRKLLRLPSKEELAQMEGDEESGEEAEEQVSPPKPSLGASFDFFDFFKWTCFHLFELEQRISSPEELEAIRTARIALHFVMHVGEYHGFEAYLETLRSSRLSRPLESFSTRDAAETWVETQSEPPAPGVVAIGNGLYSVGYNRRRALRVLIRIPTQQELDAGAA